MLAAVRQSLRTVARAPLSAATATSTTPFTVIPLPTIISVTPKYTLPGGTVASVVVTGTSFTGATFAFFPQPGLTVGSVTINDPGTATLSVPAGPNSVAP